MLTSPRPFVNTRSPVIIRGSAEADSTVTVSLDESVTGTAIADSAGTWGIDLDMELPDGTHLAKATATDKAGHSSVLSEILVFTVDTVAPDAPVIIAPGAFTDSRTPVIRGIAERNSTITVWFDGNTSQAATTQAGPNGEWFFTPTTALDIRSHLVFASATDAAGNLSPTSRHSFTLQRSHYGFGCSSGQASPATWALLLLTGSLARRSLRRSCQARGT